MRNWSTSFMLDILTREAELRVIATVMESSGALTKQFGFGDFAPFRKARDAPLTCALLCDR